MPLMAANFCTVQLGGGGGGGGGGSMGIDTAIAGGGGGKVRFATRYNCYLTERKQWCVAPV